MSDTDTLFGLLSNPVRRRVLIALCDRDQVRVPEDIRARSTVDASHPEGRRRLPGVEAVESESDGTRLMLQLYHRDLPRMEEEGVIEWDRDTNVVSRGPEFDTIEPTLRLLVTNAGLLPDGLY